MDTKELEKFCPWARVRLIEEVRQRCFAYGLDDEGRQQFDRDAEIVKGTVLSERERAQRSLLFDRIERDGYDHFCEEMAFTWFNRFAAIRFMEVKGYLSCGVRMLSSYQEDSEYDSFSPECLHAVDVIDLPGLDKDRAYDLIAVGDDESLFRLILVAQMNELAEALPEVFDRVNRTDALLLPAKLLNRGEEGVLCALVEKIPRSVWEDVEVLGWMYQFYNSELKAAFFKSKAKENPDTIGPATQLFTPEWIVRYMVENSLGRLWMLNNPQSGLRDQMEYYIEPDAEHEDFIHIDGPEDITFCDPACGSGHILVYAFELLTKMYLERGYRERSIPELILTKNLSGMEIDPRAAQIASLALAMCARAHDRRFFSRGVTADITVLEPTVFDQDELPDGCTLARDKDLLDALEHLDEVGSLLSPSSVQLAEIREAIAACEANGNGLFGGKTVEKLNGVLATCEKLVRRFLCVVANPPYMGSSSFGPFMSKWVKKNYPDVKSDLCTCFIQRILSVTDSFGFAGLATSNSWMFLSSFEKLREKIIDESTIDSLVQLSVHGFHGIAAQVCTFVLRNGHVPGYRGGYVRLNDFDHWSLQEGKTLEAIKNPDCGWFYRRNADTFKQIPGTPIAYWASDAVLSAFCSLPSLRTVSVPRQGLATADNDRFLRLWWEVDNSLIGFGILNNFEAAQSSYKWFPMTKGGEYRRWYGNLEYVVNWENDGYEVRNFVVNGKQKSRPQNVDSYFKPGISWSAISSGVFNMRLSSPGIIPNAKGPVCVFDSIDDGLLELANCNSSAFNSLLSFLSPTMDYSQGPLGNVPVVVIEANKRNNVVSISKNNVSLSSTDWDSFETSWDFKRHPLV